MKANERGAKERESGVGCWKREEERLGGCGASCEPTLAARPDGTALLHEHDLRGGQRAGTCTRVVARGEQWW